jgi:hypothetical protein
VIYFYKIYKFHRKSTVLKHAAVNVLAVLHLNVLSWLKGQRGKAACIDVKLKVLCVEFSRKVQMTATVCK